MPRLKHALLCRITLYFTVLGVPVALILLTLKVPFLSEDMRFWAVIGIAAVLVAYLFRRFVLLFTLDTMLAIIQVNQTARKSFPLPRAFSAAALEKRLARFGTACKPCAVPPTPSAFGYQSHAPLTVYSSGIEKIVTVYRVCLLDKSGYDAILQSAAAHSSAVKGKKKHLFLDRSQKKSPLNRVSVVFILAERVEERLRAKLYETVCKSGGDGFDDATLPCVIDLEAGRCTFDSLRIPFMGLGYPVKNRGIRLIRKYVFHDKLPLRDHAAPLLDPVKDYDPNESLWHFWRTSEKELILEEKAAKRRMERMEHKEVVLEDGYLYAKWEEKAVWLSVELDEQTKSAEVDAVDTWYYPKENQIAKATVKELERLICDYFATLGYTVRFRADE